MSKIKGIYAASVSILKDNLSLDIEKTIKHIENLIDEGCHGVAVFGSTGQAQLISISEKIELLNNLAVSKYKDNCIIGTGLNSLGETVNLVKIASSLNFKKFLIMPPAFYKYGDNEVIDFYSRLIDAHPECEIILYNFEKLCGYKFSLDCIYELVKKFPNQIVGIKDSSYNIFEHLKLENFSILPGSELKLLKGLELGCSGIITATCNVTAQLSRKVYEDFLKGEKQTVNQKLCDVRLIFENYNLISGLHSFLSIKDETFKNLLPPIKLLGEKDKKQLIKSLESINFTIDTKMVA
jgi:4-hydroxy-tetrahydrodipicolinate synthase